MSEKMLFKYDTTVPFETTYKVITGEQIKRLTPKQMFRR